MTVYVVYNEWEENLDEYSTWHCDLHAIFSTNELAKAYVATKNFRKDNYFTINSYTVLTTLPDKILTEEEIRNL